MCLFQWEDNASYHFREGCDQMIGVPAQFPPQLLSIDGQRKGPYSPFFIISSVLNQTAL